MSETSLPDPVGVDLRRASIEAAGKTHSGWLAEFDGSEAMGISREDALKRLVVVCAQEAL